ncbi:MAG: hypothetical protein COA86_15080 [Kangiella sp.]|nr:MAG: hypothetical protein COA86_15080 [Kangiella sp.]
MRKFLYILFLFLILFAIIAKFFPDQDSNVLVKVKVIEYLEDGRYDDYINGDHEVNDIFILQIFLQKNITG